MNEKEESSKSFWKGLVAGIGASVLIVILAITVGRVIKAYQMMEGSGSYESVANAGVIEKITVLEDTIHDYFWKDVAEADLEEGVYKGILEALDDPYSVYYTEQELLDLIAELNTRTDVDGILVQLPIPKHMDEDKVIAAISPDKDVDGFHAVSVGHLWIGKEGFVSCTPAGIIELLKRSNIDIAGK